MKKKILSVVLSTAILTSPLASVFNQGVALAVETDLVADVNVNNDIVLDSNAAYLNGYDDNTIKPETHITRGQVAKILASIIKSAPDVSESVKVSDVNKNDWYKDSVDFVLAKGIMNGFEDGTFRPEAKMTRAQFVTAIRGLTISKAGENPFTDISGHWAYDSIISAYNNDIIKGYDDNSFRPNGNIKRSEVATIINEVIGKDINLEDRVNDIKTYSDLSKTHWAYEDMIKATLK